MKFNKLGVHRSTSFLLGTGLALVLSANSYAADETTTRDSQIEETIVTASIFGTSKAESLGYAIVLNKA